MAYSVTSAEAEAILKTFQEFDENGDGFLSKEEIKRYYIKVSGVDDQAAEKALSEFINKYDMNMDDRINYVEFMQFVVSPNSTRRT